MKPSVAVFAVVIGASACSACRASSASSPSSPPSPDVAATVAEWPTTWTVTGTKSEPSYIEHVAYSRVGDRFGLTIQLEPQGRQAGGTSRAVLAVDGAGNVSVLECTSGSCGGSVVQGFLATASVVGAARQGRLPGHADTAQYAGRSVLCIDNAALGTTDAILDPCFDRQTGALLAQRSRHDGTFTGPTLDETSIRVDTAPQPDLVAP